MCFTWEVPQVNKGFWFKNLTMLYGESSPSTSQSPHGGGEQDFENSARPPGGGSKGQCQYVLTLPSLRNA